MEQGLLAKMGAVNPQPLDTFYARPSVDAMDIYLGELGQAFMLTLVANQQVPVPPYGVSGQCWSGR
jgi:hypothetical protein